MSVCPTVCRPVSQIILDQAAGDITSRWPSPNYKKRYLRGAAVSSCFETWTGHFLQFAFNIWRTQQEIFWVRCFHDSSEMSGRTWRISSAVEISVFVYSTSKMVIMSIPFQKCQQTHSLTLNILEMFLLYSPMDIPVIFQTFYKGAGWKKTQEVVWSNWFRHWCSHISP